MKKQLLKIIKYTPSIFVILISILIIIIQFLDKNSTFEKEKNRITQEYIQKNKNIIKERVNNTYNYIVKEEQNSKSRIKKLFKNCC